MSIISRRIWEIQDTKILSIEKGNVEHCIPEKAVIAIGIGKDDTGKNVKLLLKGKKAYELYFLFLKSGNTISCDVNDEEGLCYEKDVTISFMSFEKEVRPNEILLETTDQIEINFNYLIKL